MMEVSRETATASVQPTANLTTQGQTSTLQHRKQQPLDRVRCALLIVAVVGCLVVVISTLMFTRPSKPGYLKRQYCDSPDCGFHAVLLTTSLNNSARPCDNFYEYVCGSWYPMRPTSNQVEDDTYFHDSEVTFLSLQASRAGHTLPGRMFQKCYYDTPDNYASLPAFRSILEELNLYPEGEPTSIDVLDVLLGVVVKVGIGTWFNVDVFRNRNKLPITFFHYRYLVQDWRRRMELLREREQHREFVAGYTHAIGPFLNVSVSQLQDDEHMTLQALLETAAAEPEEGFTPLEGINNWTPSITGHTWLNLLNRYYDPYHNFSLRSFVATEDVNFFRVIDYLINAIPPIRLIAVIAWHFVLEHAWIAAPEADRLRFGNDKLYEWRKKMACLKYTRHVFKLFSDVNRSRPIYRIQERNKIDAVLNSITEKAKEKVQKSLWIDRNTKTKIFSKLLALKRELWPPGVSSNSSRLDELYAGFPSTDGLFIEGFLHGTEKVLSLVLNKSVHDIFAIDVLTPLGLFGYSYYLNAAMVSIAVLRHPFYYGQGTFAMNYGGLGARYARQIAKVLDHKSRSIGIDGMVVTDWWSKASEAEYEKRSSCSTNGIAPNVLRSRFGLIPGLEIAYSSFTSAGYASERSGDVPIRDIPQYDPNKIFFMSYCYTLCSASKLRMDECNFPLMNLDQFANAYRCPPETYMNPVKKCKFFTE